MSIVKLIQSFNKKNCIVPYPVPILLSPENLAKLSPEDREKHVSDWEKSWEEKNDQDTVNFEYAMARMILCMKLHGMKRVFTVISQGSSLNTDVNRHYGQSTNHYSWCPYNDWFVNNPKFIDSFERSQQ